MEHWRSPKKSIISMFIHQLKTQQFNPDLHYSKTIIELELERNMKERDPSRGGEVSKDDVVVCVSTVLE